jgi:thioredoxin 1
MINVTDKTFKSEVLESEGVVLVDFWAPWCMPCKMLGPIIEKLDKDYQGKAKVVKVNVDENQAVSFQYQIRAIPTVMVFKNGQEKERIPGLLPEKALRQIMDQALA